MEQIFSYLSRDREGFFANSRLNFGLVYICSSVIMDTISVSRNVDVSYDIHDKEDFSYNLIWSKRSLSLATDKAPLQFFGPTLPFLFCVSFRCSKLFDGWTGGGSIWRLETRTRFQNRDYFLFFWGGWRTEISQILKRISTNVM